MIMLMSSNHDYHDDDDDDYAAGMCKVKGNQTPALIICIESTYVWF